MKRKYNLQYAFIVYLDREGRSGRIDKNDEILEKYLNGEVFFNEENAIGGSINFQYYFVF